MAINQVCEIRDFTLKLALEQNIPKENPLTLESLFQKVAITIELKKEQPQNTQKTHLIFVIKENLVVNDLTFGDSGNVFFILQMQNKDDIKIKMRFEVVGKINDAQQVQPLIEYVNKTFENFRKLDQYQADERKLYLFLTPHIRGVASDLAKTKQKITISYQLKGNCIRFLGYKDRTLFDYARNNNMVDSESRTTLQVVFNREREENIVWDRQDNCWLLSGTNTDKIPTSGVLEIIKKGSRNGQRFLSHDERRLDQMKKALMDLKEGWLTPGNATLRQILILENDVMTPKNPYKNVIEKLVDPRNLRILYDHLDPAQKDALDIASGSPVTILKGEAGSGKTEVGTSLTLIQGLNNKRILVTSETNNAVDNFLERLHGFLLQVGMESNDLNIVRIYSRNCTPHQPQLSRYRLDYISEKIKQQINVKCSNQKNDAKENELKTRFKKIYTFPGTLEAIIPQTFDIVISTYGMLVGNKSKQRVTQPFDYNIIEASSGINTATFALGAASSKSWILLHDEKQLSPTTLGMYVLRQPIRYPEKSEIDGAREYDPNKLELRRIYNRWRENAYKESIYQILKQINNENGISESKLMAQYRIHPDLYKNIQNGFNRKIEKIAQKSPDAFLELSGMDFFKNKNQRLLYFDCDENTLTNILVEKLVCFLTELPNMEKLPERCISIGITSTDVNSVQDIIQNYRKRFDPSFNLITGETSYYDLSNNVETYFSSIQKHQEKEYDIVILGINYYRSPEFEKRIYTAITRAKSYAILCGPSFRRDELQMTSKIANNKKILARLRGDIS